MIAVLSGCASIQIPVSISDEPLYFIKGRCDVQATASDFAVEMYFLTSGQTELTLNDWNAISEGMVAMPLAAWDAFNIEIGKLCSQVTCNYETQQKLASLVARFHAADTPHHW